MIFNCPICRKEHQFPGQVNCHVPVVETCDFCKFDMFMYKKSSGEIYTDDAEWREISLSFYGKEYSIKTQLEEIDDALFLIENPFNEKYENITMQMLLKNKEELEKQYALLKEERDELYQRFIERWNDWAEKYQTSQ